MIWKVCGMREEHNIRQVSMLRPDMMGFIFYPKSPRYVGEDFPPDRLTNLGTVKKVGVFVNQENDYILEKVNRYDLDYVQLHGDESVDQVSMLSAYVKVIKVISGNALPDQEALRTYEPYISFWLTDSRTREQMGGSGQRFDWGVLENLSLERPIILSGGIDAEAAGEASGMAHLGVVGIDVNSRAEDAPGIKNVEKLKRIYDELHG